jgi:hypothetical protein
MRLYENNEDQKGGVHKYYKEPEFEGLLNLLRNEG